MCGIVGILDSTEPNVVSILHLMTDAITHRGPDSDGYYSDDPVGLGMRRLRIIDLNTGDQPMANEDGSILTVFNGEIYNYAELRHELTRKGHVFKLAQTLRLSFINLKKIANVALRNFVGCSR